MKNKILKITTVSVISLLIIGLVAIQLFVVPKEAPAQRNFTDQELRLFNSPNIDILSQDFGKGNNNLTFLDKESVTKNTIENSQLIIQNKSTNPIWFSDTSGVLAYQNVSGDFMVETKITSNLRSDNSKRSTGRFNSGGLAIRDPKSKNGQMNWIVYNQGSQDGFFGTELKSTQPQESSFGFNNLIGNTSQSSWFSNKIDVNSPTSELRVCKIKNELRFYIKPQGSTNWLEEQYNSQTVAIDGEKIKEAKINNPLRLQSKLPDIVQVGIMSNGTDDSSESRFNYLNYKRITDFDVCQK
jgi:hypothetical protein